ncbi:MAG: ribosome biogenesis GTP-binding protein YihA/YsxC [Bacteroidetes bacterium]|nr:ribosome biogenesis GTP-binding protein YihA/YsxC [Bacteroidota bacterium]
MEVRHINFVKSAENLTQMPDEGLPEVAFIGRSNVGKSALLNMLCRRKSLARISATPGKTQTFNFYEVNHEMYFVDIPGYGYARVSKKARAQWRRNIVAYLTQRDSLRAVLHLVDSRHPPTDLDKEVMLLLRETHAERFLVLTKADKLSGNTIQWSIRTAQEALSAQGVELPIIVSSVVDRRGRKELLSRIADATTADL